MLSKVKELKVEKYPTLKEYFEETFTESDQYY